MFIEGKSTNSFRNRDLDSNAIKPRLSRTKRPIDITKLRLTGVAGEIFRLKNINVF